MEHEETFNIATDGLMNFYDVHKPFVQIVRGPGRNSLSLPPGFTRDNLTPMPRHVTVSTSDHSLWSMKLIFAFGTAHLCRGWKKFSKYYGLSTGDIIHGAYDKDSHFRLSLFRVMGDEKTIPSPMHTPEFRMYHQFANQDGTGTDEVKYPLTPTSPDGSPDLNWDECWTDEEVNAADANFSIETVVNSKSDDEGLVSNGTKATTVSVVPKHSALPCAVANVTESTAEMITIESETGDEMHSDNDNTRATYAPMSEVERKFVYGAFYPHTAVIITEAALGPNYILVIPTKFARSELVYGNNSKVLRVRWFGKFKVRCEMTNESAFIHDGWKMFVLFNSLKVGDKLYMDRNVKEPDMWNVAISRVNCE